MTQNFYCNFLEYLSPKEKSVLLGHIQKHKVRIDGFRTIKDVPSRLLALHFSKNEKVLFDILKECYSTTYVVILQHTLMKKMQLIIFRRIQRLPALHI